MLPDKQVILTEPDGTDHPIWATVIDLGGRDAEIEFTASGIWRSRFEFTWVLHDSLIDERWRITDHFGRSYIIESVLEPTGKRAAERKVFVIGRRT